MCISATVSFGAAAVLIPLGGLALRHACTTDRRYLVLASFPVMFGVQQISEGLVWLSLDDPDGHFSLGAAMVFLIFAYVVWLVLAPLAVIPLEHRKDLRRAFLGILLFGAVFGLSLFLPLLASPDRLGVDVVHGSLLYETRLIYGSLVPSAVLIAIYACVVCLPLLTSSAPGVRPFGILVAASMLLTMLFAGYAFKSVWCYLAAISSAYLALMMWRLPKLAQRRVFEA